MPGDTYAAATKHAADAPEARHKHVGMYNRHVLDGRAQPHLPLVVEATIRSAVPPIQIAAHPSRLTAQGATTVPVLHRKLPRRPRELLYMPEYLFPHANTPRRVSPRTVNAPLTHDLPGAL